MYCSPFYFCNILLCVDLKELTLMLNYWPDYTRMEKRNAEKAFKSALSQVTHLSTFQFMAQTDFKVSVQTEILRGQQQWKCYHNSLLFIININMSNHQNQIKDNNNKTSDAYHYTMIHIFLVKIRGEWIIISLINVGVFYSNKC